jgi:hypothetical protein
MNPDEAIRYICESVRKCFPPSCNIEFSDCHSGICGATTRVRVDVWIGADRLMYDQRGLLQLLEADLIQSDGDYALIAGTIQGNLYELRLFAESQVVTSIA